MDIKGIRQRSENTYQFTVSCGFDGNGKHIRNTMTYKVPAGTTPSKVEKVVSQAFLDFEAKCKGTPRFKSNMRFSELVEIYINEYGNNELKPVTKYNYERDLEIHILPVFGNKKANSITTAELTTFFTQLNTSSETARKLKTVMSSVFSYGKTQGYVSQNPCIGALYKKDAEETKKVPPVSVHKLRHSNISLLINLGYSAKAISERAGHKSTGITTDIYSHIFESYEARMADSLEADLL